MAKTLKKGSKAARDFMAKLRALQGKRRAVKAKANPARKRKAKPRVKLQSGYAASMAHLARSSGGVGLRFHSMKGTKRNPAPRRAGYILKIGRREMFVSGIGEDEAKALAKKIARMEGCAVTVLEGKA